LILRNLKSVIANAGFDAPFASNGDESKNQFTMFANFGVHRLKFLDYWESLYSVFILLYGCLFQLTDRGARGRPFLDISKIVERSKTLIAAKLAEVQQFITVLRAIVIIFV